MNSIGIVIPSFNELESLKKLIPECYKLIEQRSDVTILIVDNGSTDETSIFLSNLPKHERFILLILKENLGYGGGILAGLQHLNTDLLSWTHADLQTDIWDILKFDFSKFPTLFMAKGFRRGRSLGDYFFTYGMSLFVFIIFRFICLDINAQPTIISRKLFEKFSNPPTDFSLDLYAFIMAKQQKANIYRQEVFFGKRQFSHSKWNLGFRSRMKFISRTLKFGLKLKKNLT